MAGDSGTPPGDPARPERPLEPDLSALRRRLVVEALGISLSAAAFGLVYGLAARAGGFSLLDTMAMSFFVIAGAAQFAAVGLVAQGVPWLAIVLLTALLNARHLLYSAALAPWLSGVRRSERAAMAHVLTDETFALSLAHFQRVGRADTPGYWISVAFVVPPFIVATAIGVISGQAIPDPATLALDIVFPAAMAGLCVALIHGRPELVAAVVGAAVAVAVGLVTQPAVGIVSGGLLGPVAGMVVPGSRTRAEFVSDDLVLLALAMGAVTYPSRALPMLAPGLERLPASALTYLRLVGPSVLAALAAVNVMLVTDDAGRTAFHVGVEWIGIAVCVGVVLWRRSLFPGLFTAAVVVAFLRAAGVH